MRSAGGGRCRLRKFERTASFARTAWREWAAFTTFHRPNPNIRVSFILQISRAGGWHFQFSSFNFSFPDRKADPEAGAAFFSLTFGLDRSPMELDQLPRDRQSEAESGTSLSGVGVSLAEAIEDVRKEV